MTEPRDSAELKLCGIWRSALTRPKVGDEMSRLGGQERWTWQRDDARPAARALCHRLDVTSHRLDGTSHRLDGTSHQLSATSHRLDRTFIRYAALATRVNIGKCSQPMRSAVQPMRSGLANPQQTWRNAHRRPGTISSSTRPTCPVPGPGAGGGARTGWPGRGRRVLGRAGPAAEVGGC